MKVNPKFWKVRLMYELHMLKVLIYSWKHAPINPKTGNRMGRIPMNINYN